MLALAPLSPAWHVLFPAVGDRPEVAVEFEPITIRAVRAARRALGLALDADRPISRRLATRCRAS